MKISRIADPVPEGKGRGRLRVGLRLVRGFEKEEDGIFHPVSDRGKADFAHISSSMNTAKVLVYLFRMRIIGRSARTGCAILGGGEQTGSPRR